MSSSANPDLQPDSLLLELADYVAASDVQIGAEALETARYTLLDALGCAMLALNYPECARHLGPIAPGTVTPNGAWVPGTSFELDPVKAAFDIGCMIRWLDFNDTWLAAEWGHPSDNFGGILAAANWHCRTRTASGESPLTMRDVLVAGIKAYEIQGVLALGNSFNRVGLDHVLLVRIATSAVVTQMLGGSNEAIRNALSQAWLDGCALRAYRHAPNTGSRKSWAAGDATSRGVRLALITLNGEMGYPTPLSARQWGFQDALFEGREITLMQPLGSYVMENILFKIAFPAEFHAQTAVEAAFALHPLVANRLESVSRIEITTHGSAVRIIDKAGPLHNPADRDHCLQYMVAIGLLRGSLTAADYEDSAARDPRIDRLRSAMVVREDTQYSADYLNPEKRSIPNAVQVFFDDGSSTEKVAVEYPLGHRRRRSEAIPKLLVKFEANIRTHLPEEQCDQILALCLNQDKLLATSVADFMVMWRLS